MFYFDISMSYLWNLSRLLQFLHTFCVFILQKVLLSGEMYFLKRWFCAFHCFYLELLNFILGFTSKSSQILRVLLEKYKKAEKKNRRRKNFRRIFRRNPWRNFEDLKRNLIRIAGGTPENIPEEALEGIAQACLEKSQNS